MRLALLPSQKVARRSRTTGKAVALPGLADPYIKRKIYSDLHLPAIPRLAMGEFHDAVSILLDAFGRGIDIIKCQRGQRKRDRLPIEPAKKNAESHLSKSLKNNRTDVKNAYGRDLARHGPGFAVGDGKKASLCIL